MVAISLCDQCIKKESVRDETGQWAIIPLLKSPVGDCFLTSGLRSQDLMGFLMLLRQWPEAD